MSARSFDDVSDEIRSEMASAGGAAAADITTDPLDTVLSRGKIFSYVDPMGQDAISAWSIVGGLMGLGVGGTFFGLAAASGLAWLFEQFSLGNRMPMRESLFFLQVFYLPLAVLCTTTAVVAMLWYPAVLLRFVVSLVVIAPAIGVFFTTFQLQDGRPFTDRFFGIPAMLMSFYVGAILVGLVTQLTTRWSLTHLRYDPSPQHPVDISMLMQLTTCVALAYALFSVLPGGQISSQNARMLGIGAAVSVSSLCGCFLFLRRGLAKMQWTKGIGLLVFLSWTSSFFFVACEAYASFGWMAVRYEYMLLAAVALEGTVFVSVVTAASFLWLRFCGWQIRR